MKTCYLAGPMEFTADGGRAWREEYRDLLKEYLEVDCIIPEEEESLITNQKELNRLKKENIFEYTELMRKIIDLDLNFVDNVDMLIVRWEGEAMSGTIHEVGHAYEAGKPCYLVTSKPFHEVPGWFLATFTEIFESIACLMMFLADEKFIDLKC